jgi:hypothetical protein
MQFLFMNDERVIMLKKRLYKTPNQTNEKKAHFILYITFFVYFTSLVSLMVEKALRAFFNLKLSKL